MRNWRRRCLAALGLIALLIGIILVMRPARIDIPPRQYPPENAYPKLVAIGKRVWQLYTESPRIERLVYKLDNPRTEATLTPADHAALQQAFEPLLREYRPYLVQPSVVVIQYTLTPSPIDLEAFRNLSRLEAYFARRAFANRRPAEGVERATALMQLSCQMSREGDLSHFFAATGMRFLARDALLNHLETLENTDALQQLLEWAQSEERHRPELAKIIHMQYLQGLNIFKAALATYEVSLPNEFVLPEWWRYPIKRQFYARVALPEYHRVMRQLARTAQKPPWTRTPADFPRFKHAFNVEFFHLSMFYSAMDQEVQELAYARLLGCVAAIRLHKQRTGRYPDSLETLQLGELAIDPFTGAPFVYRVDPQRGFLLYSKGKNRVDDGGVQSDSLGEQGDLVLLWFPDARKRVARAKWLR
jgi:hypothetical protein